MIIPIFINNQPRKHPHCPQCEKKLVGWTAPDEAGAVVVATCIFIVLQFAALLVGVADGAIYKDCRPFFSKNYEYIFPAHSIGCRVGSWMQR